MSLFQPSRFQRILRLSLAHQSHITVVTPTTLCSHHRLFCSETNVNKNGKKKKKKTKSTEAAPITQTEANINADANAAVAAAALATTEHDSNSSSSDYWRMKMYKFRRLFLVFGIPLAIASGLYALHDSDIPYVWALQTLDRYPLPADFDPSQYDASNPPPNPAPWMLQTMIMLWATQFNSHQPMKIMKQWRHFMPLLDAKYPSETRLVAVSCLIGMLSGDTNTLPPHVFFDKCLRKMEILHGYRGSDADGNWTTPRFLNMIYSLCGETDNQQIMFAGLQLLLDLTSIPMEPKPEDVQYIMERTKHVDTMREEIAESLLLIYQDPVYIVDRISNDPPKARQAVLRPHFTGIKRILIENECMKFAFSLLDAKSIQLKQLAMFILIGLVGNYPDISEIKRNLGANDDERLQNGIKLVDSLAGIGQEHFQRGDNEAALGAFTEALKYLPRSAQLHYLKGKCLSEMGRVEAAKDTFRDAMALTPQHAGPMPEATMQLCNLLIKHGKSTADIEEAAEYLELLIDSGTYQMYQTVEQIDLEDIYDRLNICLERLGRYDDALDRMLALCKLKPNSHQIHFETGRMAILCKEYDLAKEHLEYAVSLEPFDMFAKYHLALALFYLHDSHSLNEAKTYCAQILHSKPNDEKCQSLRAKIYIQENEWAQALQIYQQMKSHKTASQVAPYLQYQIAVAYEHLERESESIAAFEEVAQLWLQYVQHIGFDKYFFNRPKEAKAFQKIQARCEQHLDAPHWKDLNELTFKIGIA